MPRSRPGRVGMVLETAFPPDSRVEREALALIEAGYEVFLLCSPKRETDAKEETYHGIHVTRVNPKHAAHQVKLPLSKVRIRSRLLTRGLYKNVLRGLTGLETDWRYLIRQFIRQNQLDVLHVHDLKLLKTALSAAKAMPRCRVVADLHENYPALVAYHAQVRYGEAKARQKQQHWERVERTALPQAQHVVVVVEEARERLLTTTSLQDEDISIVRNVVDAEKFLASPAVLSPEEASRMQGRFIICYAGFLNNTHRGIQTVLAALPRLKDEIPDILFVGVGTMRKEYEQRVLVPIIDAHGLHDHVYFTGFRDESQFVPYVKQASIGLCPHLKTALTDTTFPNKVFVYQLFQKPLLVSDCIPLKRYVTETQSGLTYTAGDPQAFAEAVLTVYRNPQEARNWGQNGYEAVTRRFAWHHEKRHLLAAYDKILQTCPL